MIRLNVQAQWVLGLEDSVAEGIARWLHEIEISSRKPTEPVSRFYRLWWRPGMRLLIFRNLLRRLSGALRRSAAATFHGLAGFEVVVVDDGSTDETQQVLLELSEVYPELRWVSLAMPSWAVFGDYQWHSGCSRESGSRHWTQTCRTTRLTLSTCGMPCPATMQCWVGEARARTSFPSVSSVLRRTGFATRYLASPFATQAVRSGFFPVRSALRLPLFHGMHRFIGPIVAA